MVGIMMEISIVSYYMLQKMAVLEYGLKSDYEKNNMMCF